MLREKRLKKIYEIIQRDGVVEISHLCQIFNVTDMTIRRDLEALSREQSVVRTHGGAMLENAMDEPAYEHRIGYKSMGKEQIAEKASSLIAPHQTVFIDSGTTTLHLAKKISIGRGNIIVTNGLNIADEIVNREFESAILIGGDLKRNTHSTRGALAEEQLKQFKFDVAFLGVNAIGSDGRLYVGSTIETGIKKCVIEASEKVYVLADAGKLNTANLIAYAHGKEVDGIITDKEVLTTTQKQFKKMGINLIVAD